MGSMCKKVGLVPHPTNHRCMRESRQPCYFLLWMIGCTPWCLWTCSSLCASLLPWGRLKLGWGRHWVCWSLSSCASLLKWCCRSLKGHNVPILGVPWWCKLKAWWSPLDVQGGCLMLKIGGMVAGTNARQNRCHCSLPVLLGASPNGRCV